MRTAKEILQKIKDVERADFFGVMTQDLTLYLSFKSAKPLLREGVTADEYKRVQTKKDRKSILTEMEKYMEFAWEKANGKRGLSAGRSMQHYYVWLWMLGDEDLNAIGNPLNYNCYGKDNLVNICKRYGWDHTKWDDGVRENS